MISVKIFFSIIAGILETIAYIPYIFAIIKKKIKPAKASWIIWAVPNTIVLLGMLVAHTVNGQILVDALGCWIIVVLTLRNAGSGWTKTDKFCLTGSFLGIMLWIIFNNPLLGIIVNVLVLVIGSIPTFVSAWNNPNHEDKLTWVLYFSSTLCAIASISAWTLASAAQPIAFLFNTGSMMFILFIKPKKQSNE